MGKWGNWCWDNFDYLSGVSFLPFLRPYLSTIYTYQDIDKEQFESLQSKMPEKIDWSKLQDLKKELIL